MDQQWFEVLKIGLGLIASLAVVGAGWLVGNSISLKWSIRQKLKEHDLETARAFHALYGEFFCVWKLWNCYRRRDEHARYPEETRWQLLDRAATAEGRLESTLVRLACQRRLSGEDRETLGRFRELYQKLRESIRENRDLDWRSPDRQEYVHFKRFATHISALILGPEVSDAIREEAADALLAITSNEYERWFRGLGTRS